MTSAHYPLKAQLLKAVESALIDAKSTSPCIALSGGLDSIVLLHLCYLLNIRKNNTLSIEALHVNHGLSPQAAHWQEFCQQQCLQRQISYSCAKVVLTKRPQLSLEAQARKARYQAIEAHLLVNQKPQQDKAVLLAQHQNDQAETFFLQLLRGAGVKGLGSMPAKKRQTSSSLYVRPLLSFSRTQLMTFAEKESLVWVEDESNQDPRFDRNFLRHSVFPQLQEKWPQLHKTVARSAQHCAQAQDVIDEYMQSLEVSVLSDNKVSIDAISQLSSATQTAFLRYWLAPHCDEMPSQALLQDLHSLVTKSKNTSPYIAFGTFAVERFQAHLQLTELPVEKVDIRVDELSEGETLSLNRYWKISRHMLGNKVIESASVSAAKNVETEYEVLLPNLEYKIVFGASHLKAKLFANRPTKSLKHIYQDLQISPLQRLNTPVLVCQDTVIGILLPPQSNLKRWQLQAYLLLNETWYQTQQTQADCTQLCFSYASV